MVLTYNRKLCIVLTASAIFKTLGEGRFIDIGEEVTFSRRVIPILRSVHSKRYYLCLVCNVPEVLDGLYDRFTLLQFFQAMQEYLVHFNINFLQIYYETNLKDKRALPNPTMFQEVLSDFNFKKEQILIVGNDLGDFLAAKRGKIDFMGSEEFFNFIPPIQNL